MPRLRAAFEAPFIAVAVQKTAARRPLFGISLPRIGKRSENPDHPALSVQLRFKRDGAVWPQVEGCDVPAPVLANRAASAPQSGRMSTPSSLSR
jgi:hypothetical protein